MVAPKVLSSEEFDTLYAHCREKVEDIRRLHYFIRECKTGKVSDIERVPFMSMLLECGVRFVKNVSFSEKTSACVCAHTALRT